MDIYSGDVYLANYIGPPSGLWDGVSHFTTALFTWGSVTHTELVIDGVCYGSSLRDGEVRQKTIDLNTDRWILLKTPVPREFTLDFFNKTKGQRYDWAGAGRFVIPVLPNSDLRWYCSEWGSAGLGQEDTEVSPQALYRRSKQLYSHLA